MRFEKLSQWAALHGFDYTALLSPPDPRNLQLQSIGDKTQRSNRWLSCIQNLL